MPVELGWDGDPESSWLISPFCLRSLPFSPAIPGPILWPQVLGPRWALRHLWAAGPTQRRPDRRQGHGENRQEGGRTRPSQTTGSLGETSLPSESPSSRTTEQQGVTFSRKGAEVWKYRVRGEVTPPPPGVSGSRVPPPWCLSRRYHKDRSLYHSLCSLIHLNYLIHFKVNCSYQYIYSTYFRMLIINWNSVLFYRFPFDENLYSVRCIHLKCIFSEF